MNSKPKIVIAGGSGFLGNNLVKHFQNTYDVFVLTRGLSEKRKSVYYQHWDGKTLGDWMKVLDEAVALINLSGKSINCRFNETNKKALIDSRVATTRVLLKAIQQTEHPPKIWLNASAGAMYQPKEQPNTEDDIEENTGFLSEMAKIWEETFFQESLPKTKRASLRISLILGNDGGVFPVLKRITSIFLGGKAGSGNQMVSWIHIEDAIRAIEYIIENKMEGPINFSSNQPISNARLMRQLKQHMKIPFGLPAPEFGIKMGSYVMNTEPSLLLDSVNFIPQRLNQTGFIFNYNTIDEALKQLLKK